MGKSASFDDYLNEKLKDPVYAEGYLKAAMADEDPGVFMLALKQVARARGIGMVSLAKKSGLNRESLYKTLSNKGNPALATAQKIAAAVGFELSVRNTATKRILKASTTAAERYAPRYAHSVIGADAIKYSSKKKKAAKAKRK